MSYNSDNLSFSGRLFNAEATVVFSKEKKAQVQNEIFNKFIF